MHALRMGPGSQPAAKAVRAPLPTLLEVQEARLRDLMEDLHASFRDRVRGARGERLAAGRDEELFSGARAGRPMRLAGMHLCGRGR